MSHSDHPSLAFRKRAAVIGASLLAAAITALVYLPALQNGFVNWDDQLYVYENPDIRSMDARFFKWAFTAPVNANWHPLTIVSHAVDYALFGLDPWGHHLTSVIIHALNTFLVSIVAISLLRASRGGEEGPGVSAPVFGFTAALLFGIHPLHVESVAWVSERKDVLSGLFFLLSVHSYLRYADLAKGRRIYYSGALAFFSLSLMSKPMAVTLPVVLLILDYYPLKRAFKPGLIAEKAPFFALSLASGAFTLLAQRAGGAMFPLEGYPLVDRVLNAFRSFMFYLYKTALPADLAPFYPRPLNIEIFSYEYAGAFALFIVISAACFFLRGRQRIFSAAWLFYAVTLLPVIGIVQVGNQAAADRYMYLPGLSPLILAAAGAAFLASKYAARARAVYLAAAACLAVLAILSTRQIGIWKDSVTFWSYEIGLYPGRVHTAYNNRGLAYWQAGMHRQALADFDSAIGLKPLYAGSYSNRGNARASLGEYKKAIEDFDSAISLDPKFASAYNNRGIAHKKTGELVRAIEDFTTAIRLSPGYATAYENLAVTYSDMGEYEYAAEAYRRAEALGLSR